jgi:DNA-binding IclR family transcriptional regulator
MPRSRRKQPAVAPTQPAKPSKTAGPPYRAPALDKGLEILELLAGALEPVSVAEITTALARSRPEIYRVLVVLEARGYIQKGEDGRFDLTDRLFDIAIQHAPKRNLLSAAKPAMEELAEQTLQSCHLMINSGEHMVCIARQESPAAVGFAVQVGFRPTLFDSTSGRVYFAFQSRTRQALLLRRLRNLRASPAAIKEFVDEANGITGRGYALEPSRLTDGIQDISAPIFGVDPAEAIACLTIPFVSHRLFATTLDQAIGHLLAFSRQISLHLRSGAHRALGTSH